MARKPNGGTATEKVVKESAMARKDAMVTKIGNLHKAKPGQPAKVKTAGSSAVARQRAKRTAFIAQHGKAIAASWAALTAPLQRTMSAWKIILR